MWCFILTLTKFCKFCNCRQHIPKDKKIFVDFSQIEL